MHLLLSAEQNNQKHEINAAESVVTVEVPERVQANLVLRLGPGVETADIQATVGDFAELTLLCIQSAETKQTVRQRNTIGEGSVLHCQNVTLGAEITHSVETELTGSNAESSLDWIAYAKKAEYQTLSAQNMFHAPNGRGEMTMKSVAEDTAHVVCNGLINIGLQGGGTDTYLTEDVLMLDPTCVIDAIPGLEIKTNDVKASHSATVSRVTPADLFYFNSRGIDGRKAREMYVVGFLGGIIEGVEEMIRDKYRR